MGKNVGNGKVGRRGHGRGVFAQVNARWGLIKKPGEGEKERSKTGARAKIRGEDKKYHKVEKSPVNEG